jgi:hypothetical protein
MDRHMTSRTMVRNRPVGADSLGSWPLETALATCRVEVGKRARAELARRRLDRDVPSDVRKGGT